LTQLSNSEGARIIRWSSLQTTTPPENSETLPAGLILFLTKGLIAMADIRRPKFTLTFTFPTGATKPIEGYQNVSGVSAIALVCDSDFNTDTLTFKTSVPGDTGFEVEGATGRVNLDSEQASAFFPMGDLTIETNTATEGAAKIVVLCGC
jgi:hypothetical protein